MSRLAIAIAFIAVLAVPAAYAGGWATVTLAPPPAGIEADETWTAQLMVLRHGARPRRGDAVDHHPRRDRLADVRGQARRRGRHVRRAGRVSHGGQMGLRGERRACCDRLRRLADAHVLARRDRPWHGRRRQGHSGLAVCSRRVPAARGGGHHRHEAAPAEARARELRVYKSSGEPATRRDGACRTRRAR